VREIAGHLTGRPETEIVNIGKLVQEVDSCPQLPISRSDTGNGSDEDDMTPGLLPGEKLHRIQIKPVADGPNEDEAGMRDTGQVLRFRRICDLEPFRIHTIGQVDDSIGPLTSPFHQAVGGSKHNR